MLNAKTICFNATQSFADGNDDVKMKFFYTSSLSFAWISLCCWRRTKYHVAVGCVMIFEFHNYIHFITVYINRDIMICIKTLLEERKQNKMRWQIHERKLWASSFDVAVWKDK